jgi:acetylcholinesterase
MGKGLSEPKAIEAANQLLSYYPSDPAAGSPFGTGNETFGQPPQYKRLAAIKGDLDFIAAERFFQQIVSKTQPSWAGLFAQPLPPPLPQFGVSHGTDLAMYFPKLYDPAGDIPSLDEVDGLAEQMQSSIIGLVVDLDPNSALYGVSVRIFCYPPPRLTPPWLLDVQWPTYDCKTDGAVLEWKVNSTGVIDDTYRKDALSFINGVSVEVAGH